MKNSEVYLLVPKDGLFLSPIGLAFLNNLHQHYILTCTEGATTLKKVKHEKMKLTT